MSFSWAAAVFHSVDLIWVLGKHDFGKINLCCFPCCAQCAMFRPLFGISTMIDEAGCALVILRDSSSMV